MTEKNCVFCGDRLKTSPLKMSFVDKKHEGNRRRLLVVEFHEKCEKDFREWLNSNS